LELSHGFSTGNLPASPAHYHEVARRCACLISGRSRGLPKTDAAGIQVDEIRFGVVANTATADFQGSLAQLIAVDISQAHIDCTALHVHAAFGDSVALVAEHCVGCRRAITRNYLETGSASCVGLNVMKKIQQRSIN
jgi:hypothetical protein